MPLSWHQLKMKIQTRHAMAWRYIKNSFVGVWFIMPMGLYDRCLFYLSCNNARMITRLGRQAINPPLSGIFPIWIHTLSGQGELDTQTFPWWICTSVIPSGPSIIRMLLVSLLTSTSCWVLKFLITNRYDPFALAWKRKKTIIPIEAIPNRSKMNKRLFQVGFKDIKISPVLQP